MKKEELIEKYEEKYETIYGFPVIQLNQILEDLKQLDGPQKVIVPQCRLDDTKAFKRLSEAIGVQNATADREWLRRKIKDLDRQTEELSGL